MVNSEESIDLLRDYDLQVIQPVEGYRFSLDPLLLCEFTQPQPAGRVIDLGTGCGIIPLVLARIATDASLIGVEFQQSMAELALRNVTLNNLQDRIEIITDDILSLRKRFPVSSFDLVTANPPYRRAGSGRVSPKRGRDMARHESTAGLADFLAAAKYLVKPAGRIVFVYHPERLQEFISLASGMKLSLLRLKMVHGDSGAPAKIFVAELAKGGRGTPRVEPPLFVIER